MLSTQLTKPSKVKIKAVKFVLPESKYLVKKKRINRKSNVDSQTKELDVFLTLDDVISTEGDEKKLCLLDVLDEMEFCREMTKKSLSTIKDENKTSKGFLSSFRNDLSDFRLTPILMLDEELNEKSKDNFELSCLSSGTDKTEIDEMNLTGQRSRHGIF